jgi:hypothetical protein
MSQTQRTMIQTHTRGDLALFNQAFAKGRKARRLAALSRKINHLLSIEDITNRKEITAQVYRGSMPVPISMIQGSEERSEDFDRAFNPIKKHNMYRWMGIARERLSGRLLPAVDLIQIGDLFIVKDGHHRISVARALGEDFIDANVSIWRTK